MHGHAIIAFSVAWFDRGSLYPVALWALVGGLGLTFAGAYVIYLGRKARFVLALVASTLSLLFCALITWLGFEFWLEAWSNQWYSDSMWEVRLWIPYMAMPVGFGVLTLQYVADLFSLLLRHEMPFGISEEDVE